MRPARLTKRVWVFPFEEERDRPNLGYIRGDKWSLAVDAGHSAKHTVLFYRALEEAGLPLPALTVLTHWHWDHTLGMHAVNGLCIANIRTDRYIRAFRDRLDREGSGFFLKMHESIRREYADGGSVIAVPADILFSEEMTLDAGRCPIRLFRAPSPHTDDCTLAEVPEEEVLFLGDACCGPFPAGKKDPLLCRMLADTVTAPGRSSV